jgi:hypothetical protein
MKVSITGYASEVHDTHFIMWMANHEQIKAILGNYSRVQFTPLREYQKLKIWGGKLYKEIEKSGSTPAEVFAELKSFTVECNITKNSKSVNVTAERISVHETPAEG